MKKIDIVTTATIRPEILDQTYRSFCENLFKNKEDYRLIINIDPVGNKNKNAEDVLNVAKKYFDDVVYNVPESSSFTKAVMWCWSQVENDYVFHLEDDWALKQEVKMSDIVYILDSYEKICSVRLSKGNIYGGNKRLFKPQPCEYIKHCDRGKFMLFPRISLNPTLFRKKFIKGAVDLMFCNRNPESQLVYGFVGSEEIDNLLSIWDHSVYLDNKIMVTDLGRTWRSKMGIKRKSDFVKWG